VAKRNDTQRRERILFALRRIEKVARRRKDEKAIAKCGEWFEIVQAATSAHSALLKNITKASLELIGEIEIVVQFEIRKVLFPIQSIKDAADEAGRKFAPDRYFHWLNDDDAYSEEKMMSLLEGDVDDLKIAAEALKHD
jgi:hypothetical protein